MARSLLEAAGGGGGAAAVANSTGPALMDITLGGVLETSLTDLWRESAGALRAGLQRAPPAEAGPLSGCFARAAVAAPPLVVPVLYTRAHGPPCQAAAGTDKPPLTPSLSLSLSCQSCSVDTWCFSSRCAWVSAGTRLTRPHLRDQAHGVRWGSRLPRQGWARQGRRQLGGLRFGRMQALLRGQPAGRREQPDSQRAKPRDAPHRSPSPTLC